MHPMRKAAMVFQLMGLIAWFIIVIEVLKSVNARVELYYLLFVYVVFTVSAAYFQVSTPSEG